MLLGIFILIRTPWSNMDTFSYILFSLYILCIMMRITNLRKRYEKEEALMQKKAEMEAEASTSTTPSECVEEIATENTPQDTVPSPPEEDTSSKESST